MGLSTGTRCRTDLRRFNKFTQGTSWFWGQPLYANDFIYLTKISRFIRIFSIIIVRDKPR